jgi:heptosyltransferase-2
MKILVIQKKKIGDVLISSIILEALKKKFPDSELHYLVNTVGVAVVENNPFIDKIIPFDYSANKKLSLFFNFLVEIKRSKYDIVIDAYGTPKSMIISLFSGAKETISYKKPYSKLFIKHTFERSSKSYHNTSTALEHRMMLLKPLDIDFEIIAPKIFLTALEIKNAKNKLTNAGISLDIPILMISAIGSETFKSYPLEYMAIVLNTITKDRNIQLLFNYIPFQKEDALKLYSLCNTETQEKIKIDFYTENLREFLAVTYLCKALVGNEGGATNMAKAMNIPNFNIFSPEIPKASWNFFENETTNISVHLDDYVTHLEPNQNYEALYKKFKPSFFEDQLIRFLNLNCN